jgi:predicted lipoprotein with Yx(FWY)xxD motif
MIRSRWAAVTATALVLALSACSGDESDSTTPTTSPMPTTSQTASPTAEAEIVTTAKTDLGTILVDEDGMTLYLYTKDTKGAGKSVCNGGCLQAWPAVAQASAGDGVDASKLSTVTRDDGTKQASYNGWPLYYYAEDTAAGQTTGQAIGGVWWVLSPQGDAIK